MAPTKGTKLRDALLDWIPDGLIVAGLAGVCYGTWLIHPPMAYIVGGAGVFALGALLAWKV